VDGIQELSGSNARSKRAKQIEDGAVGREVQLGTTVVPGGGGRREKLLHQRDKLVLSAAGDRVRFPDGRVHGEGEGSDSGEGEWRRERERKKRDACKADGKGRKMKADTAEIKGKKWALEENESMNERCGASVLRGECGQAWAKGRNLGDVATV
jgi:hypothetical protein